TAGALAAEMGRVLDAPAGFAEPLVRVGAAYGLAGTLRSLPVLLVAGREALPREILSKGSSPSEAADQLRSLAASGLEALEPARHALRGLPRRAVAAALPAVLARRDLARLSSPGWRWDTPPGPRGLGDRMAVTWAGLRSRV
ncbi:MAG TPA: squalene/phytoene synthase family protein, partial [Roseomonas sp.]